jgi:D-alanyl-D-alanine carboxypeptidase
MLGSRDPGQALRSAADIQHLASQRESIVRRASGLSQQRKQLAAQAQALQSNNAVEQAKLGQEVAELKRRSAETTRQLSEMLKKIRADRERRFVLGCSQVKVAEARRYPNGLIPDRFLCDLPQRGDQLRADAALAFFKLNSAYRKRFGQQMCVTDSYRNLASQQRVYAQKPGLAAVPGRSNHGTGTAVDLCGGVQTQGSAQFRWLEANSRKYGWFHPQWAYSSPFEPWHWEFGSESD